MGLEHQLHLHPHLSASVVRMTSGSLNARSTISLRSCLKWSGGGGDTGTACSPAAAAQVCLTPDKEDVR